MDHKKLTLSVDETSKLLGIGRNSCYEAIARGEIPSIRIGKRLLVPRTGLENLLAGVIKNDSQVNAQ